MKTVKICLSELRYFTPDDIEIGLLDMVRQTYLDNRSRCNEMTRAELGCRIQLQPDEFALFLHEEQYPEQYETVWNSTACDFETLSADEIDKFTAFVNELARPIINETDQSWGGGYRS